MSPLIVATDVDATRIIVSFASTAPDSVCVWIWSSLIVFGKLTRRRLGVPDVGATSLVELEFAGDEPLALEAVTTQRRIEPTSKPTTVCVLVLPPPSSVAVEMLFQVAPLSDDRTHWKA